MRLRRLDLIRFGHFTGQSIDFGEHTAGQRDFHIIYGPNEAGKSTAVSAYLDLLYGISDGAYAFLHPEPTMRIGGVIEIGGREVEFYRIKETANSLLDAHGRPLPEISIRGELGAIEREGYMSMFSLNDDTLEAGGEDILRSRGDLGQLLFSASAGLSDLSRELARVRAEAEQFHKSYGRNTRLKELKEELTALKTERDKIDVQATRYAQLVQTRDRLITEHDDAMRGRSKIQSRQQGIERQLLALPRLAQLRELRCKLVPLKNLPEAPPEWVDEASDLLKQEPALAANLTNATNRLEQVTEKMATVEVDEAALAIAGRQATLNLSQARFLTAAKDIPKLEEQLSEEKARIREILRQVGRPSEKDPHVLLLDTTVISRLRDLIETRSGVTEQLRKAETEFEEAEHALADAKAELKAAGGAMALGDAKMEALSKAVTAARAIDHKTRIGTAHRRHEQWANELSQQLAGLAPWEGDTTALATMSVPAKDDLERWKLALADAEKRTLQHETDVERLTSDISRLKVELGSIGRTSGVVTDEEASRLRAARDEAWSDHRRRMEEASADRFESALRRDDRAVIGRLEHATDVAKLHEIQRSLDAREEECRQAHERLRGTTGERQQILSEVVKVAGGMGLPAETSLSAIETWLERRRAALDARQREKTAADELSGAVEEATNTTERLIAALTATGVDIEDAADLDALLFAADAALSAETNHQRLRGNVRAAERAVERRRQAAQKAMTASNTWNKNWAQTCSECWLGQGGTTPSPAEVRGILDDLAHLNAPLQSEISLTDRIAAMQRDQLSFSNDVSSLATALGIEFDDPMRAADLISERISEAKVAKDRRVELLAEIEEA